MSTPVRTDEPKIQISYTLFNLREISQKFVLNIASNRPKIEQSQKKVLDDETISHNYANIEQKTRAFLETLQKREGPPFNLGRCMKFLHELDSVQSSGDC